jgi:hypothetical protein
VQTAVTPVKLLLRRTFVRPVTLFNFLFEDSAGSINIFQQKAFLPEGFSKLCSFKIANG